MLRGFYFLEVASWIAAQFLFSVFNSLVCLLDKPARIEAGKALNVLVCFHGFRFFLRRPHALYNGSTLGAPLTLATAFSGNEA